MIPCHCVGPHCHLEHLAFACGPTTHAATLVDGLGIPIFLATIPSTLAGCMFMCEFLPLVDLHCCDLSYFCIEIMCNPWLHGRMAVVATNLIV